MRTSFKSSLLIVCVHLPNLFCMDIMHSIYEPKPQSIIYAPWRENYVKMIDNTQHITRQSTNQPCIFCEITSNNDNIKHLIAYRGQYSLIMLASQPYIDNGIHFLIVPYEHTREISDLSNKTYEEENIFTQKLCALFSQNCNEIHINTNQGLSAGASIPEHHHKHIIINHAPRYYNLIHAMRETKTTVDLKSLFHNIQPQINTLESIVLPQQSNNILCDKTCYHCSIIKNDNQENLIIHRGKYATAMISHYPSYFGEIDIIPNDHIESLEAMPSKTYEEINTLTIAIYPLLLKILQTQDSNIGLISYGDKATDKNHIQQKLIPRKNSWNTTPITKSYHINASIKKLYNKLLSAWQLTVFNNNYINQSAKL